MSKALFYGIITTLIFSSYLIAGNTSAQHKSVKDVKISLEVENASMPQVFRSIEDETDFIFSYVHDQVNASADLVTLKANNESVESILKTVMQKTGFSFKQTGATISVYFVPPPQPAPKTETRTDDRIITGKVTDENDQPLPGASIYVKGTNQGTVADNDGNYSLEIPDGEVVLAFTFIGYVTEEISVGAANVLNTQLLPDVKTLDDIVVIGYGEQSKRKVTGAISKVTAKDLENIPVASFDQALQGQMPGVHVSSTGTPGGAVLVRIRGQTSINAGNEPLYVVDGVPIISGSLDSRTEGFIGQFNTLSNINPRDIASIEVLKDAGATAIYGSRGANGVVLITTKKGRNGNTNINLDVFSGIGKVTKKLDVLNSEEYLMIKKEAYINDGRPIPDDLANSDVSVDTDWQEEVLRTANISQYQLSIDGGNERTTFYASASFRNEQTVLQNSGLKRGNLRLNLDHQASDNLGIGATVSLNRENNNTFTRSGGNGSSLLNAIIARPNVTVRDDLGNYTQPVLQFGFFPINPVAELIEPRLENTTSKVIASTYIDYNILPEFKFRIDAGYDFHIQQHDLFYPTSTLTGFFSNSVGRFSTTQVDSYNLEPTISFQKHIADRHQIDAIIGGTLTERLLTQSTIGGSDFINEDLNYLISAGVIFPAPGTNSFKSEYAFNSLFGRLSYNYDGKYLLSATLRRDGSSRFGKENQHGVFWAVSGGWLFSEESFLEKSDLITFAKLRASYGITGNDQIGDFANLSKWTVNPGFDGNPGIAPTDLGNTELKWEETAKFDVGLEISFWDDRISLEIDYFRNLTKNLLLNRPLPSVTGYGNIISNVGKTENKGFEFALNTVNIVNGAFTWKTRLNISTIKNEIISLADDEPIILPGGFAGYFPGKPINVFYGLDFEGVNPETGDAIYRDINDDGVIDQDDRTVIGNALPEFFGGMTNTFSWKGITLDVFLQFVNGVDLFDFSVGQYFSGGIDANNQMTEILKRWQKPGDITDVPRVTTFTGLGLNNRISDRLIWDASYLRVKNVTISYNISPNITEKWGVSNARIFLTGTNLLTISDYIGLDPETVAGQSTFAGSGGAGLASGIASANLPNVQMYIAGISFTF